LEWLDQNEGDLIVKVSLPSLTQPRFLSSLNQHLQGLNARVELTRRLTLELDAHGLVAYGDDVRTFCEEVVKAGSRVGLRRLAQQPAAIMNLHRATLDYVKLGGEFVEHLLSSPGSLRLLTAVAETTEQLGIRVYADDASDPDTVDVLQEQGVYTAA
jgi:EAL domain-containing protein (putative c-di-GMP-specific phosphodiesterase class I)